MAWSRPVANRLVPLLLLALVAGAACAEGASNGDGPRPIKESACWACHATWTPPLRIPAHLSALQGNGAQAGEVLSVTLGIQNAWVAEIRGVSLGIDLTQAPSLAFKSSIPPLSFQQSLVLHGDPTQPTAAVAREATILLTASPTSSTLHVGPDDTDPTTGPKLAVTLLYPDGHTLRVLAGGRGQAIDLPNALVGIVGPVGVRVELPGLAPALENVTSFRPPVSDVTATVQAGAAFDLATIRRFTVTAPLLVAKGRTAALGNLNFSVLQVPGADEQVAFLLNTTVHYAHQSVAGSVDWGNWTQDAVAIPLEVHGGRVALASVPPAPAVVLVNGPTMTTVSESVGYSASFLIVSSIASGGMFGKASRRGLNTLFGSAKRRVAFHNVLSYGLILAALVHMVLFLIDGDYKWTRGILFGGGGILAMLGLGVTGALQVPMIRRWSYGAWRWTHYGMAAAVILLTVLHLLLEGTHFGAVQQAVHYTDPFQRTS